MMTLLVLVLVLLVLVLWWQPKAKRYLGITPGLWICRYRYLVPVRCWLADLSSPHTHERAILTNNIYRVWSSWYESDTRTILQGVHDTIRCHQTEGIFYNNFYLECQTLAQAMWHPLRMDHTFGGSKFRLADDVFGTILATFCMVRSTFRNSKNAYPECWWQWCRCSSLTYIWWEATIVVVHLSG